MDTAQALKNLAEAGQLIASATAVLSGDLPAGHAAYFAWLTEHIGQQQARAQIEAAHAVRRTGAHKLDRESFQAISDAGTNPTIEQIEAATGHTTTGRTHFKSARGLMQDWLDIPSSTAGNRLVQADCLIGGIDDAGLPLDPWLPELAEQFADPSVDPRLVAAAALKLHSARKDLGNGKAGRKKKQQLQADAVAFLRAEPKSARKHINDLISQVKSGKRPIKALLDGIGIFKRGVRQGLVEYVLRVLPAHAAFIEAFFAKLDNPATVAGNRDRLKDADAQFTGASSEWDDEESMPDWARSNRDGPDPGDHPPGKPPGNDEPPAPWEDLKPERRRLIGLIALLMGGSPGALPEPGFATAQVSIVMNWEKMQQQAQDFAVTSSGIPLSPGEARAALCTAGIYPLVLNGTSLPLDLGRTQRLFSKAQGRAIRVAYRGCSYPGCSMPAQRCELDHLDPWEKGGRTDIASADLNCPIHHIARHCSLFRTVKIPGSRPLVLLSRELDPEQKLRVNTYFMTPNEALAAEALAEQMTARWRAGQLEMEFAAA
ncbi:HNH endonuclease [Glutamicibacter mishrai]|uniref:HNH endonuclease signature motif containing protein n=1 Tax=Glutamicibacter mishrai TaxID=1775880 RepID=UPI0020CD7274|nr:HNH endonuclease signature motif containing protein [Glutamicibacter mishrai]UTT40493.1 HNH endonuclease [Glutamicibacter mishrai]